MYLSIWSEVQTCIWPSWCHCHSLSLAPAKSRLVLPFWYWLTRVVPDKVPLNGVCVCTASIHKVYGFKLTHQEAASDRRWSLISTIVLRVGSGVYREERVQCRAHSAVVKQLSLSRCPNSQTATSSSMSAAVNAETRCRKYCGISPRSAALLLSCWLQQELPWQSW